MQKLKLLLFLLLIAGMAPSCKKGSSSTTKKTNIPPPPSMKKDKGPKAIKINFDESFFIGVVSSTQKGGVPSGVCTATVHFPRDSKGAEDLRMIIEFPCNSFPTEMAGKRAVLCILDSNEEDENIITRSNGDSFTGVLKQ